MLGVPGSPGAVGWALLLAGLAAAAASGYLLRRRVSREPLSIAAAIAAAIVAGAAPFLAWRVVQDLRVTTGMTAYDRSVAGPVQAYLQPYLLDTVPRLIPPGATYATAVGSSVRFDAARKAFPSLALETLFPRRSVPVSEADWIVSWGIRPSAVARVGRIVVARAANATYPALYVAQVRR